MPRWLLTGGQRRSSPRTSGYAPGLGPPSPAGRANGAVAVIAAATERGNEVMAYPARSPVADGGERVSAELDGDGAYQVVRHRWAGLLLEEARLEARPR